MLTRSKLKLREGELVETNSEFGRVYSRKTMLEEGSIGPDPQFIESFLAIKSMVEEMYKTLESIRIKIQQVLNKTKKKTSLIPMTTQREKGKRKAFSHLLIALCIIRKNL